MVIYYIWGFFFLLRLGKVVWKRCYLGVDWEDYRVVNSFFKRISYFLYGDFFKNKGFWRYLKEIYKKFILE